MGSVSRSSPSAGSSIDNPLRSSGATRIGSRGPSARISSGLMARISSGMPAAISGIDPTSAARTGSGAAAAGYDVGVRLEVADRLERDVHAVGHEHGERRGVALAVGGRPGADGDDAVLANGHGAVLRRRAPGGDLDVGGHPDPQHKPVAALAPGRLLGAQRLVAHRVGGAVEADKRRCPPANGSAAR